MSIWVRSYYNWMEDRHCSAFTLWREFIGHLNWNWDVWIQNEMGGEGFQEDYFDCCEIRESTTMIKHTFYYPNCLYWRGFFQCIIFQSKEIRQLTNIKIGNCYAMDNIIGSIGKVHERRINLWSVLLLLTTFRTETMWQSGSDQREHVPPQINSQCND